MHLVAQCRAGLEPLATGPWGLAGALFVAGLAGGFTHCGVMCGPFVLAQVAAAAPGRTRYGELARLQGAALLPYHLGRATTYAGLGGAAAAAVALFGSAPGFAWLGAALLALAAMLLLLQGLGLLSSGGDLRLGGFLARAARGVSQADTWPKQYALGVALGFLPCGLLYAALSAAGGAPSIAAGALAMASFAAGTVPALVLVGWGGALLGRRYRERLRLVANVLLALNAAMLLAFAGVRLAAP